MLIKFILLIAIVIATLLANSKQSTTFIVVVGPSGVGKKIDRRWMEHQQPKIFKHVPSYTTRQPRPYEHKGIDYIYITQKEQDKKVNSGMLLDQAHFGLTNYALGGDQVIKYLELGYYPITDVDFQGALQVKNNCKKLEIPVKFYAFLIDWPYALQLDIINRSFETPSDAEARYEGDLQQIKLIEKSNIWSGTYMFHQDKKEPMANKTIFRLKVEGLFIKDLNKQLGLSMDPPFKVKYESSLPMIFVQSQHSFGGTISSQLLSNYPDQFKRLSVYTTNADMKNDYVINVDDETFSVANNNNKQLASVRINGHEYAVNAHDWQNCLDYNRLCFTMLPMELAEAVKKETDTKYLDFIQRTKHRFMQNYMPKINILHMKFIMKLLKQTKKRMILWCLLKLIM